jgi:ferredoxin
MSPQGQLILHVVAHQRVILVSTPLLTTKLYTPPPRSNLVSLKISSRFSPMKVKGGSARCTKCGACEKMCPMDIRITDYIMNEKRILLTEYSLCQTCIRICAKDALKLSFGFDVGGKELLQERTQLAKNVGAQLKDVVQN